MENNVAVHVEDLTMAYDSKPVLWDVDVNILDNQITAIVGPNGAGKSTLMKVLAGANPTYTGEIYINNRKIELGDNPYYAPQSMRYVSSEKLFDENVKTLEQLFN